MKNKYTIDINISEEEGPTLFCVYTEESLDYVKQVITEAQHEFHFTSAFDLMDYVCDTYEFKWTDFEEDFSFVEKE